VRLVHQARKEVFGKQAFKDFAKDHVVLFQADFPQAKEQAAAVKEQNEALAKKYGVRGFPTVLLLDAKGNVIATTGYQPGGAEKYIDHLRDLLKQGRTADPR
jgi:protein disulfide-isomerase